MKVSKLFAGGRGGSIVAGLCSIALCSPVFADQVFVASNGSATADFTAGSGTLSLVLTNNQGLPNDLAQLLSDISFTVAGGGAISATTTSGSTIFCIDGTGCSGGGTAPQWNFSGSGSYTLTSLPGKPSGMIAPANMLSLNCTGKCPDGLGGTATSGTGLGNGQPFFLGSATFDMTIAGLTTDSKVSNVVFSFGTGPETFVGVPIPAAAWLFGSGLLGLIGIARRRIKGNDSLMPA